jgi:hypothetical protein
LGVAFWKLAFWRVAFWKSAIKLSAEKWIACICLRNKMKTERQNETKWNGATK